MKLQEKMYNDLRNCIKGRRIFAAQYLKIIIGELQRQSKKELSDNEVISIIKKLIKYENENPKPNENYLKILQFYLPQQVDKEEIKSWIVENIDFGQYKNKMQAMKPIMQHFGASVEGNTVRKILEDL